jgi:hypothetical protein
MAQGFGFQGYAFRLGADRICYACLEALGPRHALDDDGRAFCDTCAHQRLADREQLLELWKKLRGYVHGELGIDPPPATVHELSPVELARQVGMVWTGGVERILGHTEVSPERTRILIETALPLDLASEVLAHEIGHLWYASAGAPGTAETLVEGFPQWVAYSYCRGTGLEQQMKRILHRPGAMGKGVRQLVAFERKHGREAVIAAVRRPGRPPTT